MRESISFPGLGTRDSRIGDGSERIGSSRIPGLFRPWQRSNSESGLLPHLSLPEPAKRVSFYHDGS